MEAVGGPKDLRDEASGGEAAFGGAGQESGLAQNRSLAGGLRFPDCVGQWRDVWLHVAVTANHERELLWEKENKNKEIDSGRHPQPDDLIKCVWGYLRENDLIFH